MLTISPEEALELPVDELALIILSDLVNTKEWNEYNYGIRHCQDVKGGYSSSPAALQVKVFSLQERITAVVQLVGACRRCWVIGVVAVEIAVKE
jgi:hypothetical protein